MLALIGATLLAPCAGAQVADTLPPPDAAMSRSTGNGLGHEAGGSAVEHGKVTRRKVFDRVFTERGIEVEWHDADFADEAVQDRFAEATEEDALTLIARSNYVIVYDGSVRERRMSRVIVLGVNTPSETKVQSVRASPRHVVGSSEAMGRRRAAERRAQADAARRQRAIEAAQRRQAAAQGR